MKWISHKICNASVVYALTGDLKITLISTIGSILPDALELGGLIRHRTITHYPFLYIVPLVLILPFYKTSLQMNAAFWVLIGCILHLFLDALSKDGISLFKPLSDKKLAFNLYTTHHISELYLAGLICISFNLLGRANGYITMNHFSHQFVNVLYGVKHMFHS